MALIASFSDLLAILTLHTVALNPNHTNNIRLDDSLKQLHTLSQDRSQNWSLSLLLIATAWAVSETQWSNRHCLTNIGCFSDERKINRIARRAL